MRHVTDDHVTSLMAPSAACDFDSEFSVDEVCSVPFHLFEFCFLVRFIFILVKYLRSTYIVKILLERDWIQSAPSPFPFSTRSSSFSLAVIIFVHLSNMQSFDQARFAKLGVSGGGMCRRTSFMLF